MLTKCVLNAQTRGAYVLRRMMLGGDVDGLTDDRSRCIREGWGVRLEMQRRR
jgi:hypothetical protein